MAVTRAVTAPITFDISPPSWLADMARNYQATEDRRYARDVVDFHASADAWAHDVSVAVQVPNAQLPVPPPIPTREIFGVVGMSIASYIWQDPTLSLPVPAPPARGPGDGTQIRATTAAPDRLDEALAILAQLQSDIAAIKTRVSAA